MGPQMVKEKNSSELIIMHDENTWPLDVVEYLDKVGQVFLDWKRNSRPGENITKKVQRYEESHLGLKDVLIKYSVHGYHCTRLTEKEINIILKSGMKLPNLHTLTLRIGDLDRDSLLPSTIADRLRSENQADDKNRSHMLWFCLYPPRLGGQWGIQRFFRSWGGEALYNSHENDKLTGPVLKTIGEPCIIEAKIPIKGLRGGFLYDKIARIYLKNRGFQTAETTEHDDYSILDIGADDVIRIIKHPEDDFINLTECNKWNPPL